MKQKWKTALKCLAGALAALAALNLFCAWYYNPTAYEWDEARATDTIRTPGAFTSRATEGFAWMRMDENGYNNASAPGEEGVSVLMMGSSHAEALNVMQDESAAARLDEMLAADGARGMVYNIGVSSHTLPALRRQPSTARWSASSPTDCVVLETQDVLLPAGQSGGRAWRMPSSACRATDVPLPDWITGQPLARALYRQSDEPAAAREAAQADEGCPVRAHGREPMTTYVATLAFLARRWRARRPAPTTASRLIIYYHPHLALQADGSAVSAAPPALYAEALAEAAARVGVVYLDLSAGLSGRLRGRAASLPHGFANTAAGAGHLNADGPRDRRAERCTRALRGGKRGGEHELCQRGRS